MSIEEFFGALVITSPLWLMLLCAFIVDNSKTEEEWAEIEKQKENERRSRR